MTQEGSDPFSETAHEKGSDPSVLATPLRFLKGVLLAESGRRDEAATVFEQLTIDFPDMPEPYNNLAVIYAAEGKYDQALTALQAAVRAQPGYAVAQQNLGDVYVQLARISYLKAQKLDPGDATIAPKIAALRSSVTPLGTAAPAGAAVPH